MGREEGFGSETFFKVCQVPERSEGKRAYYSRLCKSDLRSNLFTGQSRERYQRDGVSRVFPDDGLEWSTAFETKDERSARYV
jgi:hypothetical protein